MQVKQLQQQIQAQGRLWLDEEEQVCLLKENLFQDAFSITFSAIWLLPQHCTTFRCNASLLSLYPVPLSVPHFNF